MQRFASPFQGAYTAPASGLQHSAQELQQFGFRTDHGELQRPPTRFLPLAKSHDHPPPPCPSPFAPAYSALHSDTDFHDLAPSRGASPSPAWTHQSQHPSLFSTRSSVSSVSTHPSSSLLSVCGGRESPTAPFLHPSLRPLSPPGRPSSPCNRAPTRNNTRPGSPLCRQPSRPSFAGVTRSASRRSHRPGPLGTEHPGPQLVRQIDSGNTRSGAKQDPTKLGQCAPLWDECRADVVHGAQDGPSEPPCSISKMLGDLDDAPPISFQNLVPDSSPEAQTSPGATTMTGLSAHGDMSPSSPDRERAAQERTIRVLRSILGEEFDLRLGSMVPPEDMVSAVSDCLDKISLSRQQCRLRGYLVPVSCITDAADTPGTSPVPSGGADPSHKPGGAARKRGISDLERGNQDGAQDDDDGDDDGGAACLVPNDVGNQKRSKVDFYPCPFRKRNPVRFNIREWEYCSKAPFKGITDLKKHIRRHHQQDQLAYKCERCQTSFASHDDLKAHIRKDPICEVSGDGDGSPSSDKYDGVSSTVGNRFRSRAEHFDWKGIWLALFPEDHPSDVPSPDFEPPVELHEVRREYRESLPELINKLAKTSDSGTSAESSQMALGIFNEFMGGVFQRAQMQALSGAHSSANGSVPTKPQPQSPSNASGSFDPRSNGRPPSSNTTNSSRAIRQNIKPRAGGGFSTTDNSGASTPASQFRNSPSRIMGTLAGTSPPARSYRTNPTPGSYHGVTQQNFQNDVYSQSLVFSSLPSSNISSPGPVPVPALAPPTDPTPSLTSSHHPAGDAIPEFQFSYNPISTSHRTDQQRAGPYPLPRQTHNQPHSLPYQLPQATHSVGYQASPSSNFNQPSLTGGFVVGSGPPSNIQPGLHHQSTSTAWDHPLPPSAPMAAAQNNGWLGPGSHNGDDFHLLGAINSESVNSGGYLPHEGLLSLADSAVPPPPPPPPSYSRMGPGMNAAIMSQLSALVNVDELPERS